MPWRLVLFLIVLALVVAFAGFNIQNVASISFGFYTVEEVPVFLSLFAAFFLGVVVMLPFTFGRRVRSSRKKAGGKDDSTGGADTPKLTEEGHGKEESHGMPVEPATKSGGKKKSGRRASKRRGKKKDETKGGAYAGQSPAGESAAGYQNPATPPE
jgi:uncharacterized integral membrane protein